MFGHLEYMGLWWEPQHRSGLHLGTFEVVQGQPVLEVDREFMRHGSGDSSRLAARPRVVGGTEDYPVTLEALKLIPGERGLHGGRARYRAQAGLFGKRFAEGEEAVLDEIIMRITDLGAWTGVSGFDTILETEPIEGEDRVVATQVRHEAPEDIRISLAKGEEITISFVCLAKGLGGHSDRVELRQEVALTWRFASPLGIYDIFERVAQIRNFLRLAVGRSITIVSVAGFQDSHLDERTGLRSPIEMYWHIPHNPEPPADPRHPLRMLFTLTDLGPDPSVRIRRWLRIQKRFGPVFDVYFGALYAPDPYLEVKFLAFAQALETYDLRRRRRPGRLNLATRTRDVLAQCMKVSRRIVGDDLDTFIVNFRNARNYYTHYDPGLEKKVGEGDLFLLTVQLQTILEMCLLFQLGFFCREIEGILDRALRFAQIDLLRDQRSEVLDPPGSGPTC